MLRNYIVKHKLITAIIICTFIVNEFTTFMGIERIATLSYEHYRTSLTTQSHTCAPYSGTYANCTDGAIITTPTVDGTMNTVPALDMVTTIGCDYSQSYLGICTQSNLVLNNNWYYSYDCDAAQNQYIDIHIEDTDTFDTANAVEICSANNDNQPIATDLPSGTYTINVTANGTWSLTVYNQIP